MTWKRFLFQILMIFGCGLALHAQTQLASPLTFRSDAVRDGTLTNLGFTAVGKAIGTTATPAGTRYVRINTDGTITLRSASELLADIVAQPLDSDLTAIAGLSTTSFGRSLLTQADAGSVRTTLSVPSLSETVRKNPSTDALVGNLTVSLPASRMSGDGLRPMGIWHEVTGRWAISVGDGEIFFGDDISVFDFPAQTATAFRDGLGLTSAATGNATGLGSGTLPAGRFPAVLPAISGENLTSLKPTRLVSPTSGDELIAAGDDEILFTSTITAIDFQGDSAARMIEGLGLQNVARTDEGNEFIAPQTFGVFDVRTTETEVFTEHGFHIFTPDNHPILWIPDESFLAIKAGETGAGGDRMKIYGTGGDLWLLGSILDVSGGSAVITPSALTLTGAWTVTDGLTVGGDTTINGTDLRITGGSESIPTPESVITQTRGDARYQIADDFFAMRSIRAAWANAVASTGSAGALSLSGPWGTRLHTGTTANSTVATYQTVFSLFPGQGPFNGTWSNNTVRLIFNAAVRTPTSTGVARLSLGNHADSNGTLDGPGIGFRINNEQIVGYYRAATGAEVEVTLFSGSVSQFSGGTVRSLEVRYVPTATNLSWWVNGIQVGSATANLGGAGQWNLSSHITNGANAATYELILSEVFIVRE